MNLTVSGHRTNGTTTSSGGMTNIHAGSNNNHNNHHQPDRTKARTGGNSTTTTSGSSNSNAVASLISRFVSRLNPSTVSIIVVTIVLTLLLSWFWYLTELIHDDLIRHHGHGTIQFHNKKSRMSSASGGGSTSSRHNINNNKMHDTWMASSRKTTTTNMNPFCQFRRYPLHRYYKLSTSTLSEQPDFLSSSSPEVEYIYGLWPTLLEQDKHFVPKQDVQKLCVNQTEWLGPPPPTTTKTGTGRGKKANTWPFADGTNPSVLLMHRIQEQASHVANMILQHYPTTYYVVTVCMTNSQCTWKDDAAMTDPSFDLPDIHQTQPNTVRTVLQLLDVHFHKLMETSIYLYRDASWGKKMKAIEDHTSSDYSYLPALDDARLFVYQSQIYVSYREGPGFGYDVQVLNPIHISIETEMIVTHNHTRMKTFHTVTAVIKASESSSFCCGRNMALMPDYRRTKPTVTTSKSSQLHALTWVDPVTVEEVDATPIHQRQQQQRQRRRRLLVHEAINKTYIKTDQEGMLLPPAQLHHRRLKEGKHKSHIHGTNAFMVPIPSKTKKTNEPLVYLGVAHFHRPNDRKPNEYARFGHHYTHAFYTIATDVVQKNQSPEDRRSTFHLTALSPEFVIRSTHIDNDAEIIQFISGLEYDPRTNQIILSYGINDCEGAIRRMSYDIVKSMLRPVPHGKQVVDFMLPLLQKR